MILPWLRRLHQSVVADLVSGGYQVCRDQSDDGFMGAICKGVLAVTKTAFVTGATGFIGRHLVDVLLENDFAVTALVRSPDKADLPSAVCVKKGDVTQIKTICDGLPENVDAVFHVAADTSSWRKEKDRQEEINVMGTQNMIDACLDRHAKRMIHVSSVAVFGVQKKEIDENTPMDGINSWVSYVNTKARAERQVREASQRGLDAVIVNPTHVVGHYDTANWARLIRRSVSQDLPGIPPGIGNFANGRAVAEAMVTAVDKAPKGANYLLGGPVASFKEFVTEAAGQCGVEVKASVLPAFVLTSLAAISQILSNITGKRPNLTPEEAYFGCEKILASSARAEKELDYRQVSLSESIAESVAYLRSIGALPDGGAKKTDEAAISS